MNVRKLKISKNTTFLFWNVMVHGLNYGLNIALGKLLGPAWFSEAMVLANIMLILSFLAIGVQMAAAKIAAEDNSANQRIREDLNALHSRAFWVGTAISLGVILGGSYLQNWLQFESVWPFYILALGLPFYLGFSVHRGVLQGRLSFKKYSSTLVVEATTRALLTLLLILFATGVIAPSFSIAIGFALSMMVTYATTTRMRDMPVDFSWRGTSFAFRALGLVMMLELSQILINHVDLLIVKANFSEFQTGVYAALTWIGKIVFFSSWMLASMYFPRLVKVKNDKKKRVVMLRNLLGVLLLITTLLTSGTYFYGEQIMILIFNSDYAFASDLLWKYCLATSLFTLSYVVSYYQYAMDKSFALWVSILAGVSQSLLLIKFHADLEQVVNVQIFCMAVLFLLSLISLLRVSTSIRGVQNQLVQKFGYRGQSV